MIYLHYKESPKQVSFNSKDLTKHKQIFQNFTQDDTSTGAHKTEVSELENRGHGVNIHDKKSHMYKKITSKGTAL